MPLARCPYLERLYLTYSNEHLWVKSLAQVPSFGSFAVLGFELKTIQLVVHLTTELTLPFYNVQHLSAEG